MTRMLDPRAYNASISRHNQHISIHFTLIYSFEKEERREERKIQTLLHEFRPLDPPLNLPFITKMRLAQKCTMQSIPKVLVS